MLTEEQWHRLYRTDGKERAAEKAKEASMTRHWSVFLVLVLALFMSIPQAGAKDSLSRAAELEAKGGMDNLKEAVRVYKQAAKENPQSYEARWMGARACRKIAKQAKLEELEDWKDICADYGKQGMELAAEAVELRPEGVEGHFYYGICVGSYSDGVSIFTALSEGLKDKTRNHLQKAYELNKRYNDATPVMALGRFYEVLPWLAGQDKAKALEYYREALRLMPEDSPYRPELHVFAGRLMLDRGEDRDRARQLLKRAANSSDPYYSEKAEEVLREYR
jgi:hypothetical protein